MPKTEELDDTATDAEEEAATETAEEKPESKTDDAGADQLGDAGKKALDRMKAERNAAKAEAAAFKKLGLSAEQLQTLIEKSDTDKAAADAARARQEAESAALAKANERLVRAEVKAAATGKLANPQLALRLLDLASFDVNEDGEVDSAAITTAIDDLIKNEPYLSAQGGKRFQGTGDGGARNAAKSQLTREDLKGMSPDQILEAKAAGRMDDLIGKR